MDDEKVWMEFEGTLSGIEEEHGPTRLDKSSIKLSFAVDAGDIKIFRTTGGMRPRLHVKVTEKDE